MASTKGEAETNTWKRVVIAAPQDHAERELYLKYYLHQWDQVRHIQNMRTSIVVQIIVLATASAAGFFNTSNYPKLQVALAILVLLLGLLGYLIVVTLERDVNIYIERARAIRVHLTPLHEVATHLRGFQPLARYFLLVSLLVAAFGVCLLAQSLAGIPFVKQLLS